MGITLLTLPGISPAAASVVPPGFRDSVVLSGLNRPPGHATDVQDGALPDSALSWQVIMHHCFTPSDCHTHLMQTFDGVSSGTFAAPDHEYPCWLELRLTATDSGGLSTTTSRRLDPETVLLTFRTSPGGGLAQGHLVVNEALRTTPFSVPVVVGSMNSVSAPWAETIRKSTYRFRSWSDGGTATHTVAAPDTATDYTARYRILWGTVSLGAH